MSNLWYIKDKQDFDSNCLKMINDFIFEIKAFRNNDLEIFGISKEQLKKDAREIVRFLSDLKEVIDAKIEERGYRLKTYDGYLIDLSNRLFEDDRFKYNIQEKANLIGHEIEKLNKDIDTVKNINLSLLEELRELFQKETADDFDQFYRNF